MSRIDRIEPTTVPLQNTPSFLPLRESIFVVGSSELDDETTFEMQRHRTNANAIAKTCPVMAGARTAAVSVRVCAAIRARVPGAEVASTARKWVVTAD